MSSISQVLRSSSCDKRMPRCFICLCTKSCFIMVSNSSLSRTLLPSASASLNACSRKRINFCSFCCCTCSCRLFLSDVASIILSDPTAVRTAIIAQLTRAMYKTKNTRQAGFIKMSGFAISSQLSTVVSWKSVKSDEETSWNFTITVAMADFSSSLQDSVPTNAHPRPNRCVNGIPQHQIMTNMTVKIQMNSYSMVWSATEKSYSFLNILRIRKSLNNRDSLMRRTHFGSLLLNNKTVRSNSNHPNPVMTTSMLCRM
mmetsp:Transcript_46343/g.84824  ORF Transcript_46343/g.84824 Transcript_46343/m.84824 type:complete len:257 (+) Transcript_46343:273-1043(+)